MNEVIEAAYAPFRTAVLKALAEQLVDGFTATEISESALAEVNSWPSGSSEVSSLQWRDTYSQCRQDPRRFEFALWRFNSLVALSVGGVNQDSTMVSVEAVKVHPSDLYSGSPLFDNIITAYKLYADAVCAGGIKIISPGDASLVENFNRLGFIYIKEVDYMIKQLPAAPMDY